EESISANDGPLAAIGHPLTVEADYDSVGRVRAVNYDVDESNAYVAIEPLRLYYDARSRLSRARFGNAFVQGQTIFDQTWDGAHPIERAFDSGTLERRAWDK